jgi:hypothetical protein
MMAGILDADNGYFRRRARRDDTSASTAAIFSRCT